MTHGLTPRGRVINAFRREKLDKVPKNFGCTPQICKLVKEKTGSSDPLGYCKYSDYYVFWNPGGGKRVVRERIKTVGKDGSLLIALTHMLEPEVPWKNILAFFEAVEEFGRY